MMQKLNNLIASKTPCIFLTNFEASSLEAYTLSEAKEAGVLFAINHNQSYTPHEMGFTKIQGVSFQSYKEKFDALIAEIESGNTYLCNLTQPTKVAPTHTLHEIFTHANAPYKILYKDSFVCFSPEPFVTIHNSTIATYPMKGTIDARLPNAKEKILSNQKEMAEHVMVVDLLRNDLGIVARNVKVEKFRFITTIQTKDRTLLQVSSKITATLPQNWHKNFWEWFSRLLPAGSISGTPKRKTVEIIKRLEGYERGFFTGIFGYFDGTNLNSCVMIRFLEKKDDKYLYKSGGGITLDSDAKAEYNELFAKVYIP